MANEENTNLGFDASSAINSIKELVRVMDSYNTTIQAMAANTRAFNAAGQKLNVGGGLATLAQSQANARKEFEKLFQVQKQALPTFAQIATAQRTAAAATTALGNQAQGAAQNISVMGISLQSLTRIATIQVLHQVISALRTSLVQSVQAAHDFEISLAEITTIGQGVFTTIDNTADAVLGLSEKFGLPALKVAEGLYQTLSNQVTTAANATKFLDDALGLSIAAVSSTSAAVNALSSIINSYGLSAANAGDLSAKLFKIVELGRLRLEDIGNSLGRVTVVAAELGVSFDEVGAAIAAITVQGVKPAEALTQISSVMQALIKPSEALKATLANLGFTDVQAAIQATGGVFNLLKKIIDSTGGSLEVLGEEFRNVRALRGVLGLLANDADSFNKSLEAIGNAKAFDVQAQIAKVLNTNAKQLDIAIQQVNNSILQLGRESLAVLVDLAEAFGGGRAAVLSFVSAVGAAGAALLAFRAVGLTAISAGPFLALTAAAGLTALAVSQATRNFEELKLTTEKQIELARNAQKVQNELLLSQAGFAKTVINSQFGAYQDYFAKLQQLYNKDFEAATRTQQQLTAQVKLTLSTRLDAIEAYFSAVEKIAKTSSTTQLDAELRIRNLTEQGNRAIFDSQLQFLSTQDKVAAQIVLSQRLVQAGAQEVLNANEKIKEVGRQHLQDAFELAKQALSTARTTDDRERAEGNIRSLMSQQASIERQLAQAEIKRASLAAKVLEQDAARVARLKEIAVEIEKQSQIIKLTGEGKGLTLVSREQLAQAKQQIQELTAEFNKTQAELGAGAKGLGLESLIEQAKVPIKLEFVSEGLDKIATQLTNVFSLLSIAFAKELEQRGFKIDVNKLNGLKELQQQGIALSDAEKVAVENQVKIKENQDAITEAVIRTASAFTQLSKVSEGGVTVGAAVKAAFQQGLPGVEALFQRLKDANAEFDKLSKIDDTDLFTEKGILDNEKFTQAADTLIKAINDFKSVGQTSAAEAAAAILAQLNAIRQAAEDNQKLQQNSPPITTETQRILDAAKAATDNLQTSAQGAANSLGSIDDLSNPALSSTDAALANTISQVNALTQAALVAGQALASLQVSGSTGPIQAAALGGKIQYFSQGGGPRGRDNQLAWLSPGEFVMNAKSTRQFYAQLVAMNKGIQPRYFSQGGPVTNVGDITVNVQGGRSSDATARDIGNSLRREIRRGTLKLS